MKYLKREKPISKAVCRSYKKALYVQSGRAPGESIYKEFHKRYNDLIFGRPVYTNAALNRHLIKNILPGIALYDAFIYSGLSKEDTLDSISCFYEIIYKKTGVAYRALGRIPFFFQLLRKMAKRSMSVTYPNEGWTTTWIENSDKIIAFDVSRCFYQDVLKKYEHEELLKCFCRIDDYVYEYMSQKVQWKRTATLGRCGSICDFRFIAKEAAHENK
jgi:hypothetical protein